MCVAANEDHGQRTTDDGPRTIRLRFEESFIIEIPYWTIGFLFGKLIRVIRLNSCNSCSHETVDRIFKISTFPQSVFHCTHAGALLLLCIAIFLSIS